MRHRARDENVQGALQRDRYNPNGLTPEHRTAATESPEREQEKAADRYATHDKMAKRAKGNSAADAHWPRGTTIKGRDRKY